MGALHVSVPTIGKPNSQGVNVFVCTSRQIFNTQKFHVSRTCLVTETEWLRLVFEPVIIFEYKEWRLATTVISRNIGTERETIQKKIYDYTRVRLTTLI